MVVDLIGNTLEEAMGVHQDMNDCRQNLGAGRTSI